MLKKIISSIIICAMLLSATVCGIVAAESLPFVDVADGIWYYKSVKAVYDENVMVGVDSENFKPLAPITRASFVVILAKLAGADVKGYGETLEFTDTLKNTWYSDYLGWAVKMGLANGRGNGKFAPNDSVTRQEIAVFLNGFINKFEIGLPKNAARDSFVDEASFATWAADAIDNMRYYGIISGNNEGYFNPTDNATRAEVSMMLYQYLEAPQDPMLYKYKNLSTILKAGEENITFDFGPTENSLPNDEDLTIPYFTLANFKAAVLERLGLSADTYEIIMNDARFDGMLTSYKNIQYGETSMAMESIGIKNKVTGEETATTRLRFYFNKVEEIVFVDPDNFDPKIDADFYESMMDTSLYSTGNIARLAAAFAKAEAGEDITVGYIGGSITEGASATWQKCWARISANWLVKHFPDSEIGYVNAGISGTPSSFGNMRLNRDLLNSNPDIVFVEFAVNDDAANNPIQSESFESMVRTILAQENNPAVVIVISYSGYGYMDYDVSYMKELAALYGLPVVDVESAIVMATEAGYFTREEYIPDGTHPHYYGHQLMSDMIENLFKNVIEMAKTATEEELTVLPLIEETYHDKVNLEDLTFVDPNNFTVDSMGTWEMAHNVRLHGYDYSWYTESTVGAEALEFTFTGSRLVFALAGTGAHVTCGYLEVTVDGVTTYIGAEAAYFTTVHEVSVPEGDGEHHVSVKLVNWDVGTHILGFAYGE